jgi:hypothetical protein
MSYDIIYYKMYTFSHYKVQGILLCRLLAPIVLISLLWVSRIISSVIIKFFSVLIAMLLYFFPNIVGVFYG